MYLIWFPLVFFSGPLSVPATQVTTTLLIIGYAQISVQGSLGSDLLKGYSAHACMIGKTLNLQNIFMKNQQLCSVQRAAFI